MNEQKHSNFMRAKAHPMPVVKGPKKVVGGEKRTKQGKKIAAVPQQEGK